MRQVSTLLVLAAGIESATGFSTPPSRASTPSISSLHVGVAPSPPTETASAEDIAKLQALAEERADPVVPVMDEVVLEAPVSQGIQPGRYDTRENSVAIPFLKRPAKLDGTHAGDFGFDPLGLTEDYDLYTMQESELRHGRLAMLAVVGWPLSELVAPDFMLQDGRAPSVLNGFNPVSFLVTVAAFGAFGFFEYKTALRKVDDKPLGIIHKQDMADVWEYGVAGDYNFDPLGLYSSIGDDALARKGLREVEISHGRSAMLGITAFAMWEALTGAPIVQDSMFFHPNLLLPALVAGYVGFNTFYELEESDMYYRFKLSSEGEARMENMKLGAEKNSGEGGKEFEFLNEVADKVGEKAGVLFEKIQETYKENLPKGE